MVTEKEFPDRIEYLNEKGQLHREDGPAREYSNGSKEWWINGQRHREDGPAVESDVSNDWYINGQLHREDGPAVEWSDGTKWWYLNSKRYTEQQWQDEVIMIKLERLKNYGN
jgi:hypothetical protein